MEASLRTNKRIAAKFHDLVINKKDFESAREYVGDSFEQHRPYVPGGTEGLRVFIEYLRTEFPDARAEIKKMRVEGDYVVLYVHLLRVLTKQKPIVEIFRLKDGKIHEHWAVARKVPEDFMNPEGTFC